MKKLLTLILLCSLPVFAQNQSATSLRRFGDKNAPLKTFLFSSFSCPHCKTFHQSIEPKIFDTYVKTGKINMTVVELARDPKGMEANQLIRCVPPEKYRTFSEKLFSDNSWKVNSSALKKLAQEQGLSEQQITECLVDKKLRSSIYEQQRNLVGLYKVRYLPSLVLVPDKGTPIVITATDEGKLMKALETFTK